MYEKFVLFMGFELQEKVLKDHLRFSETHRIVTYLVANTDFMFVKVSCDWMRDETTGIIRNCDHFTLL